jgi:hypothetical protein
MSTPETGLNLSRALEPVPAPRPKRPRETTGLNLARALEPAPVSPARPRPSTPHAADDYLLEGDWTPDRAEGVKGWFRSTYGRDLPHSFGQTPTHDRMGLDHSASMDVRLSPQSEEGRAFAAYLRQNRIPYLAYNKAVPGAATGPHFHVGRPSRGLGSPPAFDLGRASEPLNLTRALEPEEEAADVTVNAAQSVSPPPGPLRRRVKFDPGTLAGRQERDLNDATGRAPGSVLEVAVALPAAERLSDVEAGREMMRAAYVKAAAGEGIPADFAESWVNGRGGARLSNTPGGPAVAPADALTDDALDASARTLRVRLDANALKQMADDYRASGTNIGRAAAWAVDPNRSAGERASAAVAGGADLARRAAKPLDMFKARMWTRLGGGTAEQAVAASDAVWNDEPLPEYAQDFISADIEKDMSRLHPAVGKAYGFLSRQLLDPFNYVGGVGAVKYAGRLSRVVGAVRSARTARQVGRAVRAAEELSAELAAAGEGADLLRLIGPGDVSRVRRAADGLRRLGRDVVDVVQLPKAKAGFDLSAPARQGLPQVAAHPSYLKQAYAEQVKAFASEDAFNSFVQSIRARDDFAQMQDAGLYLSGMGGKSEEVFASGLVKHIPGVAASDRAYSAALDSIRVQAWDNYRRYILRNPGAEPATPETWKAVAELINISTGRGVFPILDRSEFGRKIVDALNVPFFSPRNMAGKFNLLSPLRIVRNASNPATRPVAWLQARDAFRGLTVMGTTLGLIQFAGPRVGVEANVNPFSDDFGKVRVGKMVVDLSGGEGWTVRYLARMAQSFMDIEQGKTPRQTPGELTKRYLRSQLQPSAAVGVDFWTGERFDSTKANPKPFTYSEAAADLSVPFVVQDVYKGWVAAGGTGAEEVAGNVWYGLRHGQTAANFRDFQTGFRYTPAALLSVLGIPVNFYDKSEDYEEARERAKVVPRGVAGEEFARLGIVLEELPKGERITVPDYYSFEGLTGDAVGFQGEHLGQSPEDLQRYRETLRGAVERNVAAEVVKPDYKRLGREAQRSYLLGVVAATYETAKSSFLLEARKRQVGATEGLLDYQKRLEGRLKPSLNVRYERPPKAAEPLKLDRALEPAPLNLTRALEP